MTRACDTKADPTLARLRRILDLVEGLRVDPELKDYDDKTEAEKLLREALRVAERKRHLIRKLSASLRAKDRRMARFAGCRSVRL